MSFQKNKPFRNKKLLQAAKDCPVCMDCGKDNDGTIVAAHYTGFRQHSLGKGVSQKCTDTATAFLCYDCHTEMDKYVLQHRLSQSEEFLFAIIKTHDWLLKEGVMNID